MKLLILGGTVFIGRHLVDTARSAGHTVTLFNRGQSNAGIFPEIEQIHGDRDGGLGALASRRWDAVIDTCGYVPRIVRASAEALAGATEHYTFISTLSVFRDFRVRGMNESAPIGTLEDPSIEVVSGESYGPLKALCEREVDRAMPGRALVIRPGLIVGPHDKTDRFTYWPERFARGGEVLAPVGPGLEVQIIDARDLAEWTLALVESGRTGTFNATGPASPLTLGEILKACHEASGVDSRITWVDETFLFEHQVQPWTGLPLWVPQGDGSMEGFAAFDCSKAIAAGLRYRPIGQTVADTLAWARTLDRGRARLAGLSAEREREVLAAWHARA